MFNAPDMISSDSHIFEPPGHKASDKRACFLVIHGGGWTGMEPRRMFPFADHFAKLSAMGWTDLWRHNHPDTTEFTWYSKFKGGTRCNG